MANPKATYEITSKDKSKKGVNSAKKGVQNLSKAGVKSAALMVAKWAAVAVSIKQVTRAVRASIEAFEQQEVAEISLAAAARNNPLINGEAYRGLTDYAAGLERVTTFGDEALIQQASFLTTLQLSEGQIKDVLDAATDLASTGMMTLESATRNLAKTYGGMSGELGELIPQLKDLTTEQLQAGEGIELIAQQYDGFAETVARSSRGIKEQLANMWGTFGENIGEALAPLQVAIINKVKPILDSLSSWLAAHSREITNFFLHIPEIAALAFEAIREGFRYSFSFEGILDRLRAQLTHMKNVIVATFQFIGQTFVRLGRHIILIWGQVFRSLWDTVKRVGQTIWSPLSAGFEWVVYGVRTGWRGMIDGLAGGLQWLINNPINWLGEAFYNVVHGIGEVFEFVLGGVADLINNLIDGLNTTFEASHNIRQAIAHPFREDKREEWGGGIGNIGSGPNIDWGRGFEDFTADIIPQWEETLTPPDRNVGSEISEVWHGYGQQLTDDWMGTFEALGDNWEGFGGDVADYFKSIADSQMGLNRDILAPFREQLQAMGPIVESLLNEELPFEIRSVVDELVDQIDETTDVVSESVNNSMTHIGNTFGDIAQSTYKPMSVWELFTGYLEFKVGKLRDRFEAFFDRALEFGKNIVPNSVNTFKNIVDFIKDPFDQIATAGFRLIRNFDDIAANIKNAGNIFLSGLKGLGQLFLKFGSYVFNTLTQTEAFQEVMSDLGDVVSEVANSIIIPLIDAARPLIDVFISLISVIGESLKPGLEAIGQVLGSLAPLFASLAPVFRAIGDILLALEPILRTVAQVLEMVLVPIIDIVVTLLDGLVEVISTLTPVIQAIMNVVLAVLMPVIDLLASVIDTLVPIIQLVADALAVLAPIIDAIAEVVLAVLTPIFQLLGDLLTGILVPIVEVLSSVLEVLTPIFQVVAIVLKALVPIINVLGQFLLLLIEPIIIMVELFSAILVPVLQLLSLVLQPLVPIFQLLAWVVDLVTRPFEFLADVITFVVDVFSVLGHNLIQFLIQVMSFGFAGGDYQSMPSFSSDAFTRPIGESGTDVSLPDIGDIGDGVETTTDGGSVGDMGRGASYGGQNLTVNVEIMAEAIVGEPGLREFAIMIDDEIRKARNLGVV